MRHAGFALMKLPLKGFGGYEARRETWLLTACIGIICTAGERFDSRWLGSRLVKLIS